MKKFLLALGLILVGMAIGMGLEMEAPGHGLIVPILFAAVGGTILSVLILKEKNETP